MNWTALKNRTKKLSTERALRTSAPVLRIRWVRADGSFSGAYYHGADHDDPKIIAIKELDPVPEFETGVFYMKSDYPAVNIVTTEEARKVSIDDVIDEARSNARFGHSAKFRANAKETLARALAYRERQNAKENTVPEARTSAGRARSRNTDGAAAGKTGAGQLRKGSVAR